MPGVRLPSPEGGSAHRPRGFSFKPVPVRRVLAGVPVTAAATAAAAAAAVASVPAAVVKVIAIVSGVQGEMVAPMPIEEQPWARLGLRRSLARAR